MKLFAALRRPWPTPRDIAAIARRAQVDAAIKALRALGHADLATQLDWREPRHSDRSGS